MTKNITLRGKQVKQKIVDANLLKYNTETHSPLVSANIDDYLKKQIESEKANAAARALGLTTNG